MAEPLLDWLALREPADVAARSEPLTRMLAAALTLSRPLRIVDLGSGTGSNIRYLRDRIPSPQEWIAIDRDPALLARAPAGVQTCAMELGVLEPSLFASRHLITASALLDLASSGWIDALAEHCCAAGAAVLFALTYNGRSSCTPADEDDEPVRLLFNEHQRRSDKGFGQAAGPDAAAYALDRFAARGYRTRQAASDWRLATDARALQRGLIEGWAEAACEIAPAESARIERWRVRRIAHVDAGRSSIVVGHDDIAAWP